MSLLPKQLDGGMLIHVRKTMEKLFKFMSVFMIKISIDPFKALILLMNQILTVNKNQWMGKSTTDIKSLFSHTCSSVI